MDKRSLHYLAQGSARSVPGLCLINAHLCPVGVRSVPGPGSVPGLCPGRQKPEQGAPVNPAGQELGRLTHMRGDRPGPVSPGLAGHTGPSDREETGRA